MTREMYDYGQSGPLRQAPEPASDLNEAYNLMWVILFFLGILL